MPSKCVKFESLPKPIRNETRISGALQGMNSTFPVNTEYMVSNNVIVSINQLASGNMPNNPNVNQNAGIVIGISSTPSSTPYCLSRMPLPRMIRFVIPMMMNENLLKSSNVISAGL